MGELNIGKTVTIACPVSNRDWILEHYLKHIYSIQYDHKLINLYFVLNNSKDNSEQILKEFKQKYDHEYNDIKIDYYNKNRNIPKDNRSNEVRLKHTYFHLSVLRNKLLEYASKNTDYLLSVDSDILVKPDVIHKLLSANKDICASLIWNGYLHNSEKPYLYPNILSYDENKILKHVSNYHVKNAPTLSESKILEINATGAVCLMSKDICRVTKYSWHNQGEDMFWSEDCQSKGYKLYVDCQAFSYHIMSEKHLELYLQDKTLLHK